ncbi:MAG TPA: ABC transporter ATP-binding protein [Gammaproteobacteria bacterium]
MIELKNIEKTYRKPKQPPVRAVNRVSLSVRAGEFVAVLGPSGSGKSTLMNVIGLLARPDAGEYVLDRAPVAELRDDELARVRNRVIGFVFQSYHLLARMTAEENVWQPLLYSGSETRDYKERSAAALAAVGLADRRRHFPGELSGGQQQRVAIARALVNEPKLLLADEPTGNLDSESARDIVGLFKQQNTRGTTVILITHDPNVAREARRIVRIGDGTVIADDRVGSEAA